MLGIATMLLLSHGTARAEGSLSADLSHWFSWGNNITWFQTGIEPQWSTQSGARFGVVARHYELYSGGEASDDVVGMSAAFGDVDTFQVKASALSSTYSNCPTRLDGSLELTGSERHFRFGAAYLLGGIESAPSAEQDLITTAGTGERIAHLSGRFAWATSYTSAYVKGQIADFSDGNRYHLVEAGALQDLGWSPLDLAIGGILKSSGYAATYAYHYVGYYSYPRQSEGDVLATARAPLGRHVAASATGTFGRLETAGRYGTYDWQNHGAVEPALTYDNRQLEISASGSFSEYVGGATIPNYAANTVRLDLRAHL